jgi:CspA family cold shock protein
LAQGRIDWYRANRGHGFILPEYGAPKLSLRREDIAADGEKDLEYNDRVSYEVTQGTEGWRRGASLGSDCVRVRRPCVGRVLRPLPWVSTAKGFLVLQVFR